MPDGLFFDFHFGCTAQIFIECILFSVIEMSKRRKLTEFEFKERNNLNSNEMQKSNAELMAIFTTLSIRIYSLSCN